MMKQADGASAQSQEREHTANDLEKVAGLSYRQVNTWEARNILPKSRKGKSGWRKFNAAEILGLAVCAEFRRQLKVPLARLPKVMELLLRSNADYVGEAIQLHYFRGRHNIFLVTDLEERCYLLGEEWLADLFRTTDFAASKDNHLLIVLPMNSIIEKLVRQLRLLLPEWDIDRASKILAGRQRPVVTWNDDEAELLELTRRPGDARITTHIKGGKKVLFEVEVTGPPAQILTASEQEIVERLGLTGHQTLRISSRADKIHSITRKTPKQPGGRKNHSRPQEEPAPQEE